MSRIVFSISSFIFFLSLELFAESYTLINQQAIPDSNFNTIVAGLKSGDKVEFSDGKVIELGDFLGAGNTTRIFGIAGDPNKAIRIPLDERSISLIKNTQAGYAKLMEREIPVVKIYNPENNEYAIVDRLGKNSKTFDDMVAGKVSTVEKTEMIEALKTFMRKTASLSSIGDFRAEQMLYDVDKKKWVLFDWTSRHDEAFSLDSAGKLLISSTTTADGNLFVEYIEISPNNIMARAYEPEDKWISKLWSELRAVVQDERAKMVKIVPRFIEGNKINFSRFSAHQKSIRCSESFSNLLTVPTH